MRTLALLAALALVAQTALADGDTLWLDGKKFRLWGIDAPESKQPYGPEATAMLDAIRPHITTIVPMGRSYDRTVALVHLSNGSTAQAELLRAGLAWVEPRYCTKLSPCMEWKMDEGNAKEQRKGLWVEDEPIEPWRWRHGGR